MLRTTKNLEEVFVAVDGEAIVHIAVEEEDDGTFYMRLVNFSPLGDEYDASAIPPKRFFYAFILPDSCDLDDLEESDTETTMTGDRLEQELCAAVSWIAIIQGD